MSPNSVYGKSVPLDSFKIPAQRFIDWMNLIRKTDDDKLRYDYLEAFWESQVVSKQWMISEFKRVSVEYLEDCHPEWIAKPMLPESFAYVFGGWHGLAAMFLVDNIPELSVVYSIDKNPINELLGKNLSNHDRKIAFQTYDMEDFPARAFSPINTALVVNTSTEHITQEQYNAWIAKVPPRTWVILQGNNFNALQDHVRTANSLEEFKAMNPLDQVWYSGEIDCKQFTRYMVIGYNMESYRGLAPEMSAMLSAKIQKMITRTSYEL
jgi:hypothetical protein